MKFLLEWVEYGSKTRSKEISLKEAIDIYKNQCSDWDLNSHNLLYRQVQSEYKYSTIDPSKYSRKSRNTSNHYTMLMDKYLDSWSKYPDRSNSVIMTSKGNTHSHKNMIPFNDSKIAVCPKSDLWFSFQSLLGKKMVLDHFNYFLQNLKLHNRVQVSKSIYIGDKMIKNDDDVNEYLKKYKYKNFEDNFRFKLEYSFFKKMLLRIKEFWKNNKEMNLYDLLNDYLLNPKVNGFDLVNSKDFQKFGIWDTTYNDNECWSSDPFLIINDIDEFKKHLYGDG